MKPDQNLAKMIAPVFLEDALRARGGIVQLRDLGVLEPSTVEKFHEVFEEIHQELGEFKGIIATR